jgi:carbon monoxide dehydrogenase subunit G
MAVIEPFGGEERFTADAPTVYAALTDLDTLAASIPDLVSTERVDDRTLKAVVRPGFSFLRGTLRLTLELERDDGKRGAVVRTAAEGIGVGMKVEATMSVEPDGTGSKVRWQARVPELRGLVTAVGPSLIKAAADRTVRDAWDRFRQRVQG